MASHWYDQGLTAVAAHTVDLLADTVKVMLLSPSYTFDKTHSFVSAVNSTELSGAGYVGGFGGSGRLALTSKTVTRDDVNFCATFAAANPTWTAISAGTAAWAVLIKEITNDAASLLIAAIDINPDVATTSSNFIVSWNASGILRLAYT